MSSLIPQSWPKKNLVETGSVITARLQPGHSFDQVEIRGFRPRTEGAEVFRPLTTPAISVGL
jgi:hypothetical protein